MDNFHTEAFPDPETFDSEEKAKSLRHFLIDLLETIFLSIILFLGINAVSARIRVESVSMQPTLYEGDFVIVSKVAYKVGKPNHGDVIIFLYPPDPSRVPYIKRVIGLPGDKVSVASGKVYINDVPIKEPYIKAPPSYTGTWEVPPDSIFVLGDNRNNSSDSHSWGMVPLKNVLGKAEVIYWPPNDWQTLSQTTAAAAGP
jgi:signal peptidase I